ncbi:MAG: hypothetical protein EBU81_12030, partial [Proteobacteria bacterium]|nr:hypothetical protein [Pseudomonadota bacterium]
MGIRHNFKNGANNLISRGLKRLALVISDDFSGLKEAISALFPRA